MGCSTTIKISIDIRMNTRFAGENKFLEKFARRCARCYWWEYMKEKTHKKLNISLPNDLHAWVLKKQDEENKKSRFSKTPISNIIAYAIEQAKMIEEQQGKVVSPGNAGAKTPIVSESSASSRSTATRNISRRAG